MTHAAFLDAIRAEPDDDTHRLVYADWLDDHGDPERAEFIRTQIAAARAEQYTPGLSGLYSRQHDLLEAHREAWLAPLAHLEDPAVPLGDRWTFERGFVEEVRLTPAFFLAHIDAILQAVPLRRVYFVKVTRKTRDLFQSPALARIPEWAFINQRLEAIGWTRLGQCPAGGSVRSLLLASSDMDSENAPLLANAVQPPILTNVTLLNLAFTYLGDHGLEALANFPGFANLETLALIGAIVGQMGLRELARSPVLANLRTLSLGSHTINARAIRGLVDTPLPPRLTALDLELAKIGSEGVAALADAASLAALTRLDLVDNSMGPVGAQALARSPYLTHLRELNLATNRIGDTGAEALAGSAVVANLVSLNLGYCGIKARGIRALAASPHLANLEHLDLGENALGGDGVQALVDAPHLNKLKVLDLSHTPLQPRQIAALRERYGAALNV